MIPVKKRHLALAAFVVLYVASILVSAVLDGGMAFTYGWLFGWFSGVIWWRGVQ